MINIIGSEYLESNLETGEFSYESALKKCGANWNDIKMIEVPRFYPSCKTCYECDSIKEASIKVEFINFLSDERQF